MAFNRLIPFVGFHTRIADHEAVPALIRLLAEGLAPLGCNALILEFNPGYSYRCFPQYTTGTFNARSAALLRDACRKHHIRLIPLFQGLSHQSDFSPEPWPLFKDHPELLETPDISKDAAWPDFYCHSWCASNDDVYKFVLPMIDELADVFEPEVMHIGIDEVFELGEDSCPRCRGKNKADLLARTVKKLYDHLASKNIETMMWGDRLLDAAKLGYQMWEADKFGMHPAFDDKDRIRRDIMICDWHYDYHDHGYPSVDQFMEAGFYTIPSVAVDIRQVKHFWSHCLEAVYLGKKMNWPGQMAGMLFTHWTPLTASGVDDLLRGIRRETVDRTIPFGSGETGEVIGQMMAAVKQMRKVQ